jgi:hypothetical protein
MIDRADGPAEPDRDTPDGHAGTPVTVRLGSGGRGPETVAILIAVFVALALVKPWAWGGNAGSPRPTPRVPAATANVPSADPLADLRAHCQEPNGWRIYSRERWARMTVRSWKSFAPASAASGPLDPGIPVIPIGAQVDALGYCSPWSDVERPPVGINVTGWRIGTDLGYGGGPLAVTIALHPVDPGWPSVLGALYGPPVNRFDPTIVDTAGWPAGRYVFAIRAPGYERWWGVDVVPPGEIVPPGGVAPRDDPGPTPASDGARASPEPASP